jgi:hypothetical protein
MVLTAEKVTPAHKVIKGQQALQEIRVIEEQRELKVQLDQKVIVVPQELPGHKGQQAGRTYRACGTTGSSG